MLRRLDGLLAGDHAGLLPGHGTERGEARPYVAGDDPRHIDWAVTARTHDTHVRDTIADHELELWLVVDRSSSLAFGTARATKHEIGWAASGAFALLASRGGNRVGAVSTGDGERPTLVPARSGRAHVGAVLAGLRERPADGQRGNLAAALEQARRAARHRGLVVVVSDFQDDGPWDRPLAALAQRHDVVAVQVADPREARLTDVGLVAVVDPESGRRRLVDTASSDARERYAALATTRQAQLARRLAATGADHLVLRTDRDWVLDLVRFVASRRQRRLAAPSAAARPAAPASRRSTPPR